MVGFRDWLRTHDEDFELYERTKRELAARDWKFVQHYADAKTEVVESIIARARGPTRRSALTSSPAARYSRDTHEPLLLFSMPGMNVPGR